MQHAWEADMIAAIDTMTSGGTASFATSEEDRPKLLVVDDVAVVRDMIALVLRKSGYLARGAASGNEARALVALDPPALLITDLNMPDGDGWDLIGFCRAHYPRMPILIVSGDLRGARPEIEQQADGYLNKPFGFQTLVAEVTRLLPAHQASTTAA